MDLTYQITDTSVTIGIQAVNAAGQPVKGVWILPAPPAGWPTNPMWSSDDTVGNVILTPGPDSSDPKNPLATTECRITPKAGVWPKVLFRAQAYIDLGDGNGPTQQMAEVILQFKNPNQPVGVILLPNPGTNWIEVPAGSV